MGLLDKTRIEEAMTERLTKENKKRRRKKKDRRQEREGMDKTR